ncbi:MAG TPA: nuclear transport factor 2 family protein [Egibacteraceae bacterium]|nr:nuclear transport factor 2 family protein [Egibacteraceae bacterium]
MGGARDEWERLSSAFEQQDVEALLDLYAPDSVYLEPHNPPHEGNRLIQAYLSSWLQARDSIDVAVDRMLVSDDGLTLAVEWSISYSAGGRRWNNLPRSSWIEVDDGGIRYHRDYF